MRESVFSFLNKYSRPYRGQLLLVIAFSILSVVFTVLIPRIIGRAINLLAGPGQFDIRSLLGELALVLFLTVLAALAQYLNSKGASQLSYRMGRDMRRDIFYHIHKLPLASLDSMARGSVLSLAINDVDQLINGLIQTFTSLFTGLATILGVLAMVLSMDWRIAVLLVLLTPLSVLVSGLIANRNYKRMVDQLGLRADLTGYVNEMLTNHELVKGLGYQARSCQDFNDINQDMHASGFWSQFYGATINPTTRLINSLIYAVVGLAGALLTVEGAISVGFYTSLLAYVNQYTKPFNEISTVVNELQSSLAAASRIQDFLLVPAEEEELGKKSLDQVQGWVEFDRVDFSYSAEVDLIQDFSLKVRPGQRLALVGPTGAGKSTIINLLMRFYEPDGGRILLDGVDARAYKRDDVRSSYGMVLQNAWIFYGTVRDNIAYGRPQASQEEVVQASKKAKIHQSILQMEDGYDTILDPEAGNLSAGQLQLISIARVLLMDPDMLVLDEATSSIDSLTELRVQEAFDMMMEGRTSFVVAHRLSTIESADIILYMEDGQVKDQGSHQELMEKEGSYYRLYTSQYRSS